MKVLPNVSRAAENTPEHRDRIVDAVRGVSLVVVVFGHLLLAVVYWPQDDPPRLGSLMLAYPWTQVLTWILQVMPLFFAFGGAANARAWIRAKETHTPYSTWMWGRIQRLLRPVTIYLLVGAAAAWITAVIWGDMVAPLLGQLGVQLWFLGVYIVTTALLPGMLAWHQRSPAGPFLVLVPIVIVINLGTTIAGWPLPVGIINVILVWLLLQQLGFFWRSNPQDAQPRRWA
ncbi:MAG: acyltransferase family protein, partial [Actinomycetota bacterium]|nr:acyltransferase family protein [Actinomycetota bacterium]